MFSVYGLTGPVFRGKLESLSSVVPAITRVEEAHPAAEFTPGMPGASIRDTSHGRAHQALVAYSEHDGSGDSRHEVTSADQIMNAPVITVTTTSLASAAWKVLRDHGVHQAPVLDNAGVLVGIVSERDLLTAMDLEGDRVIETRRRFVSDLMTTPVITAHPETPIRQIAAMMLTYRVTGVPVIDAAGGLGGFVSRSDLLRVIATQPAISLWR